MSSSTNHSWKSAGPTLYRSHDSRYSCETCLSLSLDRSADRNDKQRIDFSQIVESAQREDCLYCTLIYQTLIQYGANIPPGGYNLVGVHARKGNPFYLSWEDKVQGRCVLEIYAAEIAGLTILDESCEIHELGVTSEIIIDPQDEGVYRKIQQWVVECDQEHTTCLKPSFVFPRRLLDLGEEVDAHIKLVQDITDVKYVALSHCWGDQKSCITVSDNLASRLGGISFAEFPKTFQDAVIVTRKIGLRYLWIDSLCIIQDDRKDWETESAIMGAVYEGAYLTIAAALASSDENGFLHPSMEREAYRSTSLEFSFQGRQVTGIRMRLPHDFRDQQSIEPLASRGWTYQERLLSRRLLTFSSGVTFECRQAIRCECGQGPYPNVFGVSADEVRLAEKTKYFSLLDTNTPDPISIYEYWSDKIVANYSDRRLTRESDRLPALSALAKAFQAKLGDEYLAGLWRNNLIYDLLWVPHVERDWRDPSRDQKFPRSPQEYRAPSWSWASIEGPITHVRHGFRWAIDVLAVESTPKTPNNPFGEVQGGFMTLIGRGVFALLCVDGVQEGELQQDADKMIYRLDTDDEGTSLSWTTLMFDSVVEQAEAIDESGTTYPTIRRSKLGLFKETEPIVGHVLVMLFGTDENYRFFMVLGGLADVPGAYQRIGHFKATPAMSALGRSWFEELPAREVTIF